MSWLLLISPPHIPKPSPPSVFYISVKVTICLSCLILRARSHHIHTHTYIYAHTHTHTHTHIYISFFFSHFVARGILKVPWPRIKSRLWQWKLWTTRELPRSPPCFLPFPHYSTWSGFPVNPFGSTLRTHLGSTSIVSKPPSPLTLSIRQPAFWSPCFCSLPA